MVLSFAIFLWLAAFGACCLGHTCIHDLYVSRVFKNVTHRHGTKGHCAYRTPRQAGRALASSSFQPIRITALYISSTGGTDVSVDTGSAATATFLTSVLMPAAVARWQALLNVQRVSGALLYAPTCTSTWTTGQCASYSALMPASDSTEVGITVPPAYLAAYTTATSCLTNGQCTTVTTPAGAGLGSTDFAVYVSAKATSSCTGNAGLLAYAITIQRDQYDRPIWGRVNFCPSHLNSSAAQWASQLSTAVHELNHALGFSSTSWPLWRLADGVTPRTPRDATTGLPGSAYKVTGSCGTTATVAAPGTIAYYPQRGMTGSWAPTDATAASASTVTWSAPGNSVAQFVTPAAAKAAQAYFGCPTLAGPELENQDTTSCFVQGSHWEGRVLRAELMCTTSSTSAKVSAITLGVHEDSGWYTANYAAADGFVLGDWGYAQGCDFSQSRLSASNVGSPPHYVMTGSTAGDSCTQDYSAKGTASVSTYASALPTQYQYFGSPAVGAINAITDYAPAIAAYSNGACATAANGPGDVALGQTYGTTASKCHTAVNFLRNGYAPIPPLGYLCLSTTCAGDNLSYTITLSTGAQATCATSGASLSFTGFQGTITCGVIGAICPGVPFVWTATGVSLPSATPSATPSPTYTPTAFPTPSPSSTPGASPSGTPSLTPSSTVTPSLTPSPSRTPSQTPSVSPTTSETPTLSISPTGTGSLTPTLSGTLTGTVSGSGTLTSTPSTTATASPTPSASPTGTGSLTPTLSGTLTGSVSGSGTLTSTPSTTATASPTPSASPTVTPTLSTTPSTSRSGTPTGSTTATPTPSKTTSRTPTASLSQGASVSSTPTPSRTPIPPTGTPSGTRTRTVTPTGSATSTPPVTPGASASATPPLTPSPSATATMTPPSTPSRTSSRTPTPASTPGITPSATSTPSAYPSESMSNLPSPSNTPSPSTTRSAPGGTPSPSTSLSATNTPINPARTVLVPIVFAMPQNVEPNALALVGPFFVNLFAFDATTTTYSYQPSPLQDDPAGTCKACVWSGYTFNFLVSLSAPIPLYNQGLRRLAATTVTDTTAAAAQLTAVVAGKTSDGSLCVRTPTHCSALHLLLKRDGSPPFLPPSLLALSLPPVSLTPLTLHPPPCAHTPAFQGAKHGQHWPVYLAGL
jgi:leishmanolysin-like peptidase